MKINGLVTDMLKHVSYQPIDLHVTLDAQANNVADACPAQTPPAARPS